MRKRQLTSIFSDALLKCALEPERNPRPGQSIRRRIQKAADALMTRAELGDLVAMQLVFDRLEGKAVQPVDITTDARLTVSIGGIQLRDDTANPRDNAIDVTDQGDSSEQVQPSEIGSDTELIEGVMGAAPPTHDGAPAEHETSQPALDPMDALRARILASLV